MGDQVKKEKLAFHEVNDWLNAHLTAERKKIADIQSQMSRARVTSITAESTRHSSTTIRLEVRFGRRVFEVKMKKHDKLATLLQTLPRIIGEDAEAMEIFVGRRQLDPTLSLNELDLNNNDILRMLHRKKVASFLRKWDRKNGESSGSQIDMDSYDSSSCK